MKETKEIYLRCSCGSEILHFEYDADVEMHDVAIFEMLRGAHSQLSWRDRFRYCWQVISKGRAYGDCLMLSRANARKLCEYIGECEQLCEKVTD